MPFLAVLRYSKEVTLAVDSNPPVNLMNTSAAGLLAMMHLGGSVGFAPAAAAQPAAARALHSMVCGAYEAALASPYYAEVVRLAEDQAGKLAAAQCAADPKSLQCKIMSSMDLNPLPGGCSWFPTPEAMDLAGGWFPFAGGGLPGMPGAKAGGLYIGLEVGESSLLLRHETLLLVDDPNGDPEEKNAARAGVLAMQAGASGALILHGKCPDQTAGCNSRRRDCHLLTPPLPLGGVSIGMERAVLAE